MTGTARYVILRHGLDRTTADRIRSAIDAKRVFGLSLEPEPERVYPQVGGGPGSTLAAHLIGFVNREGSGQYGIEQYYQATLAGEPRIVVAQRDASGLPMLEDAVVSQAGAPGTDLRLTIDAGLQLKVEQELLAAWVADRAKRASAVVMDPYTGEIYASATYPSYDGNDYKAIAATDPGRFIDPTDLDRLRARVGVQDDDRGRGADERDGHPIDPDQGRRHPPPGQGPDQDRRRRPQGHGLDDVRGRRRLFAQRGRREGGARARQVDPRIVGDPATTCGSGWATGSRPGSTSPGRSAASSATRR